ncbi:MAG: hypothetical protein IPL54_00365 [Chitinophagaceae bacterium]|nr:hypothetical protein [Chitinophagaceae bacterium]
MKKYIVSLALGLMIIAGMSSCFHHRHDISIAVSEDEDEYEMDADYGKSKSHAVQVYLNNHLLTNSNTSVHNGFVDDEITLDDESTFYINANPGELSIRINKNENSEESCERVKRICEDIKVIIEDN